MKRISETKTKATKITKQNKTNKNIEEQRQKKIVDKNRAIKGMEPSE